ncbi:MAG TPA: glycosyltransferase family 39 protein [Gemmatimonadales bacterium]|nr:glycosyltransferase family 39 protein [Gemmatimonadales bacterium]
MTSTVFHRPPPSSTVFHWRLIAALSLLTLGLHVLANLVSPYGFHRDEFLYFAMGRHLQLFRMDFPPAIAILAEAVRGTLGDGLFGIRLVPALCATLLVLLAGLFAWSLGGGRYAQFLAGLAVLGSPLFMRTGNLFQPVVLDQVAWTLALLALAWLAATGDGRWWLAIGAACGFGLLAKFSIAFIGFGIFLATLATPLRRQLGTRWPWLGAALALAIGAPSIVGQIRLDLPIVLQMRGLSQSQLEHVSPLGFVMTQLLFGPGTLLAVAAAVGFVVVPLLRPFRVVGWACLVTFLVLLGLRGKAYYFGPVYPALYAAGAVTLEHIARPRLGTAVRWGAVILVVAYGLFALPIGLPILPPEAMARYAGNIGAARRNNQGKVGRLPQDYADMLGWEEQVRAVARVYDALPAAERAEAVIVGDNYGEAGALEFYGPRYGLPAPISAAGTYWQFGPGDKPGTVVIVLGEEPRSLRAHADSVVLAARVANPWGVEEEQDVPIVVGRRLKTTLQALWPSLGGRYR